ncbi:MAG: acetaldehyde dehydrogenase, partial [Bacteroidetes bacterium]|nr:acetaldehyde dehydrogenase [Bacteroidota bacterium]
MKKVLDIDDIMTRAKIACEIFGQYNQEKVDKIVRAVYEAGFNQRIQLARMACEETGIGKWEDKTAKNIIATRYLYH